MAAPTMLSPPSRDRSQFPCVEVIFRSPERMFLSVPGKGPGAKQMVGACLKGDADAGPGAPGSEISYWDRERSSLDYSTNQIVFRHQVLPFVKLETPAGPSGADEDDEYAGGRRSHRRAGSSACGQEPARWVLSRRSRRILKPSTRLWFESNFRPPSGIARRIGYDGMRHPD
jgi:hypothetical protein